MEKCECTNKRNVQVMDYDENIGTCLTCYRQVDLTPDKDIPSFFRSGGEEADIRFLGKYEFPVHHWTEKDEERLFVGCLDDCPFCKAKEEAEAAAKAAYEKRKAEICATCEEHCYPGLCAYGKQS